MSLTKYVTSPYNFGSVSYSPLFKNLNYLLSETFGDGEFGKSLNSFNTRFNLDETDSEYSLSLELPGYSSKEVKVEVEDYVLLVNAENEKKGKTSREIVLWEGIDFNKVSGAMKDGILTVTLPKIEKVKPRQIQIN